MRNDKGFTLVEIIIAIIVLTIGILGLTATAAMVTRMIGRGQRSALAASFAAQRMDRLRVTGCTSQNGGSETLLRGSTTLATQSWSFTAGQSQSWRITLITTYKTVKNRTRTDTLETSISCLF